MKHSSGAKEYFRVDVLDEIYAEQEKRIHAFDHLMKILAIDEIDKGEEREMQKCWEKFGKARKISTDSVQKQIRPHGAMKLKDPESHQSWTVNGQRLKHYLDGEIQKHNRGYRNFFTWASRESPARILQRKKEKMLNFNSRPGEFGFAWAKIRGAYWNGFAWTKIKGAHWNIFVRARLVSLRRGF